MFEKLSFLDTYSKICIAFTQKITTILSSASVATKYVTERARVLFSSIFLSCFVSDTLIATSFGMRVMDVKLEKTKTIETEKKSEVEISWETRFSTLFCSLTSLVFHVTVCLSLSLYMKLSYLNSSGFLFVTLILCCSCVSILYHFLSLPISRSPSLFLWSYIFWGGDFEDVQTWKNDEQVKQGERGRNWEQI